MWDNVMLACFAAGMASSITIPRRWRGSSTRSTVGVVSQLEPGLPPRPRPWTSPRLRKSCCACFH